MNLEQFSDTKHALALVLHLTQGDMWLLQLKGAPSKYDIQNLLSWNTILHCIIHVSTCYAMFHRIMLPHTSYVTNTTILQ